MKAQHRLRAAGQLIDVDVAEREIVDCEGAGDRLGFVPQHLRAGQRLAVVFELCDRPLSWFPARQRVLRGTEAQTLDLHQPADGVAVGAAGKAVIVVVVDVA